MMNMRSLTRARAAEIASSSTPRQDHMNIEFTKDFKKNRYKRLEGQEVETTK
jgi:hypothetical protein